MTRKELEIWRPINYKDCGEMYEISQYGDVRRRDTKMPRRQARHKNGYYVITLSVRGKQVNASIHRLVALTFVPNPDPEHFNQVSHIDENRANNCASNLEWTDALRNNLHGTHISKQVETLNAKREKETKQRRRSKMPVYRLIPQPDGSVIGEHYESIAKASRETGVKRVDIRAACRGIRETAGGYRWVFAYSEEDLKRLRDR